MLCELAGDEMISPRLKRRSMKLGSSVSISVSYQGLNTSIKSRSHMYHAHSQTGTDIYEVLILLTFLMLIPMRHPYVYLACPPQRCRNRYTAPRPAQALGPEEKL